MKILLLALTGFLLLAIIVATGLYYSRGVSQSDQVVCTQEVKICPDGSYVGRTGPKCEFAPCPGTQDSNVDTSTWKTYRNEKYGLEIEYPDNMYVSGPEVYDSYGKTVKKSRFSIGIHDKKYEGRIEGEIPQLVIVNYHYGNAGRDTKIFSDEDIYSDTKQKLYEWIAEIHFQEGNDIIEAKCILFKDFEADGMKGLPLCNKILSTFELTN